MVQGVSAGFSQTLEIIGVGYRAEARGQALNLSLGFSHPILFQLPPGVAAKVDKQTVIVTRELGSPTVGRNRGADPPPASARTLQRQGRALRRRKNPPQGWQSRRRRRRSLIVMALAQKELARTRRRTRVRRRVRGADARPRLCVFRSGKHIYAQVISDETGRTLASASTLSATVKEAAKKSANKDAAKRVGALIAQVCQERGIRAVVFDRNGFLYHGGSRRSPKRHGRPDCSSDGSSAAENVWR
jgi:large subunit ribosomal protein L18